MNTPILQIQNLILEWFSTVDKCVSHSKVRDICNACAFAVTKEVDSYCLQKYFYPLVRAGFIECGIQNNVRVWQTASPAVFYKDINRERKWIGINLTEEQQNNNIPGEIELFYNSDEKFEQHENVVRWTTGTDVGDFGLPVIANPPALSLLRSIPACTPNQFATPQFADIFQYSYFYSPRGQVRWVTIPPGTPRKKGLYRQSEKIYSNRLYFHDDTYKINNNLDAECWAKVQHCIDNGENIAEYNAKQQTIRFFIDPPILLSRILFLNQMFDRFYVNSREYFCIGKQEHAELNRIFHNRIIGG